MSNALATQQAANDKLALTFKELDTFASENSITKILESDGGGFSATLKLASAIGVLRERLTPEVMKPIMALQGSALGFRTDKDKDGGYKEDVVKEVLIEATMKGFRLVGNETNIIGGRFYAARDGFERIFRDLGKAKILTDLRLSPGVPKTTSDGAIVLYSASWTFKNLKDEIKDMQIPIRVNTGQSADAILGKAKRKILAAIYSRITGTEITEGEVDDVPAGTKTVTPVTEAATHALPADLLTELEDFIKPVEEKANAYFIGNGSIAAGQTFRNLSDSMARRILKQKASFLNAIGASPAPAQ